MIISLKKKFYPSVSVFILFCFVLFCFLGFFFPETKEEDMKYQRNVQELLSIFLIAGWGY